MVGWWSRWVVWPLVKIGKLLFRRLTTENFPVRDIKDQVNLVKSMGMPYVGLLKTKGENWTWYVDSVFIKTADAYTWFMKQKESVMVFNVTNNGVNLVYGKNEIGDFL